MNTREDRFSKKILATPPSGIRKFFDLIIGRDDIISLGVGEPDFPTPWQLREEAFYHLEKGQTSYTSNWGLLELREEIARYLARYGMYYSPKNEIIATIGGSEAVDAVLRFESRRRNHRVRAVLRFVPAAFRTVRRNPRSLGYERNGFYPDGGKNRSCDYRTHESAHAVLSVKSDRTYDPERRTCKNCGSCQSAQALVHQR